MIAPTRKPAEKLTAIAIITAAINAVLTNPAPKKKRKEPDLRNFGEKNPAQETMSEKARNNERCSTKIH